MKKIIAESEIKKNLEKGIRYFYNFNTNNKGWRCETDDLSKCFKSKYLDEHEIYTKIECILLDLHELNIIDVSNSTESSIICMNIANKCFEEKKYDQKHIIKFIFDYVYEKQ